MTNAGQPKYSFGLLETPCSSSGNGTSGIESGSNARHPGTDKRNFRRPGPYGGRPAGRKSTVSGCTSTHTPSSSTRDSTSGLNSRYNASSLGSGSRLQVLQTPATGLSSAQSCTPGSRRAYATSSATPARDTPSVIVAVAEARGHARGEIGMASIDLKRPVLTLSQFNDATTYVKVLTKLQILHPLEIVLPDTACENSNLLYKMISNHYQDTYIAMVPRKYFNEEKGMQYIKQLCLPELISIEMEVRTKYYCLCAAAALLKYVEFIQNVVYASSSLKVVFKGSEQTTMIDAFTAVNLELLHNLRSPKSTDNLYGILNSTKTHMGSRLLRANILQPPSNLDTINMRLEAVSDLIRDEETFYNLQAIIGRFLDVDNLLSACIQVPKQESIKTAENMISHIIYLKHTLELVDPLKEALKDSTNALFKACHSQLEDPRYKLIMDKIRAVIQDDTRYQKSSLNMRTQKCFAVKPNINGLLDVSRRTYSEVVDDINELIQELGRSHGLPIKGTYNPTRGFHMSLYCGGKDAVTADSLPGQFTKVTKFKNTFSFTTSELIKLNDRVKDSLREVYIISAVVVKELLTDIRQHMECLYKLSECVAMLDMLLGFANNCTLSDYVRPEFTDTLAIKGGRHPILDKICREPPVPNNVYASDESNFVVITGPNMSGKSTYLRQIALLQIMAQVGSYVPAEYASFRLADQIFSRISSEDDIATNSSTFMVEMKEVNYIVRNASRSSIIIMDELGRGTSVDEGIGICHATCEYLLNLKAFTFFATHFLELTNLDSLYHNVANYHFEVQRMFNAQAQGDKVIFTHVLSKGKTNETHYGIELAEASTLPRRVVEGARQLSKRLAENKKRSQQVSQEVLHERAVFKLGNRLLQTARNSRLDESSLRAYLCSLKEQYYRDLHGDVHTRASHSDSGGGQFSNSQNPSPNAETTEPLHTDGPGTSAHMTPSLILC